MNGLNDALLITVLGMGLVFTGILLLWGLIALLMRAGTWLQPASEDAGVVPAEQTAQPGERAARRAKAAALAVATAVALDTLRPPAPRRHALPLISAWQAVLRTNQLRRGRR